LLGKDSAHAEVAHVNPLSKIAVSESQPKLGKDGETSSSLARAADQESATPVGRDSGATETGILSTGGDNNFGDPAESAAAAGAGNSETTPFSGASTSPGSALVGSPSSGRGAAIALGQRAEDDESNTASPDPSVGEESVAMAGGGTALSAGGAGTANEVAVPVDLAPNPSAAPVSAPGVVSESLARAADADRGPKGLAACTSSDDEIVAPTETVVSVRRFASGARLARGASSQTASGLDDPAAALEETPGPRCADLVSEFLLLDRAALESAIDRFLDQFDNIAAELAHFDGSAAVLTTASVAALTALASGVIIQRRRSPGSGTNAPAEDREEELTHFSGLPNSWNWGLAGT